MWRSSVLQILTFGFLRDNDDALVVRSRGDADGFRADNPAAGEAVESRQVHGLPGEDLALRQSTLHHEGRSVADDHPMQIGRHIYLVFCLLVMKNGNCFLLDSASQLKGKGDFSSSQWTTMIDVSTGLLHLENDHSLF